VFLVYDAVDPSHADVSIIDFAHVFPITNGARDEGYLLGLNTLIGILSGFLKEDGSTSESDKKIIE